MIPQSSLLSKVRPQLSGQKGGILFVGEAPADEETIKGYPLVGASGFLLSRALRAANMVEPSATAIPTMFNPNLRGETRRLLWERREHSFTNVFDFQLPNNEVKSLCRNTKEAQTWKTSMGYGLPPLAEGYLTPDYLPQLDRLTMECRQTQPNLIVPLGGTALWAFTGEHSIESYRGAASVATRIAPGTKLLPTYHPAHVLRQYKLLTVLIGDLLKAKAQATYPEIRPEAIELWLEPTLEDLAEFERRHVRCSKLLSLDIETSGRQISCVGVGTNPTTGLVLPFVDYRKPDRSYWPDESQELEAWAWVQRVLETDIPKLGQNFGEFDAFWFLDKAKLAIRNYCHDLRLVHHVLLPELPKSLAFMGATYTNLPAWKAGMKHDEAKRDS